MVLSRSWRATLAPSLAGAAAAALGGGRCATAAYSSCTCAERRVELSAEQANAHTPNWRDSTRQTEQRFGRHTPCTPAWSAGCVERGAGGVRARWRLQRGNPKACQLPTRRRSRATAALAPAVAARRSALGSLHAPGLVELRTLRRFTPEQLCCAFQVRPVHVLHAARRQHIPGHDCLQKLEHRAAGGAAYA